jgi:hypothetical protein
MYKRLLKGLEKRGSADGIHAASALAIEFLSGISFVLLIFLALRWVSLPLAAAVALITTLLVASRTLTFQVLAENDDRFETLLHYMVLTFAVSIILLGGL